MSVSVWIGRDYRNAGEHAMVAGVIRGLTDALGRTKAHFHILCNLSVPVRAAAERKGYRAEIDMAVLRQGSLTVLELKNYCGAIAYGESGPWICRTETGQTVEIKGGRADRTPFGQIREYREHLIDLLEHNRADYLDPERPADRTADPRHFVTCRVVFPDTPLAAEDRCAFSEKTGHWAGVVRTGALAESLCRANAGWSMQLNDRELLRLIEKTLRMRPAEMIGDTPMVRAPACPSAAAEPPAEIRPVAESYAAVDAVLRSEDTPAGKIGQLFALLLQLLRAETRRRFPGTSMGTYAEIQELFRDIPDLRARVNRFRILANRTRAEAERPGGRPDVPEAEVRESVKTLCLLAAHFTDEPIPAALKVLCDALPDLPPHPLRPAAPGSYVRLLVTGIDPASSILQGYDTEAAEDPPTLISVRYRSPDRTEYDRLDRYVRAGDIVLLTTPLKNGNAPWTASAIVLWPDFLISPESLGHALEFQQPGMFHWLGILADEPRRTIGPIPSETYLLRGNFASRCLADAVAGTSGTAEADEAAFRLEHTAEMLSLFGDDGPTAPPKADWLTPCRECHASILGEITRAIPAKYPDTGGGIWQIEAPFFSPVYGFSARVDALMLRQAPDGTLGSATVFELKSGKWQTWPSVAPRTRHRIQPRVYADILHAALGIRRENVRSLLYYAGTVKGVSGHEFNETATAADIRYYAQRRNEVLAVARTLRTGEFRALLNRYTPDIFCPRHNADWGRYGASDRQAIERILTVLKSADPLTSAYYFRFLAFVAEEDFVSRLGGGSRNPEGVPLWRSSAAVRREEGYILDDLVPVADGGIVTDAAGRIVGMRLDTSRAPCNRIASIRAGDTVCLYGRRGGTADLAHAVAVTVTVRAFGADTVDVDFVFPQHPGLPGFAGAEAYVMEPQPGAFSSNSYKNLWHVLTGVPRRRDIVLGRRLPEALPPSPGDPPPDAPGHTGLVAAVRRARDLFLLWGPPGTGKTSHAMRALVDDARAGGGDVLLMAYTYRAADEICAMLDSRGEPYICLGTAARYGEAARRHTLTGADADGLSGEARADRLRKTHIFVGPVAAVRPDHPVFALKRFALALVDEASQLLDHHIAALFCCAAPESRGTGGSEPLIGRFVLIGDDLQLPAVVTQDSETAEIGDRILREHGFRSCAESFFSRIRRRIGDASPCFGKLLRHHRMHPDIAAFVNLFYRELIPGGNGHQLRALPPVPDGASPLEAYVLSRRLACIDIRPGGSALMAKSNAAEAAAAAAVAAAFRRYRGYGGRDRLVPDDLGIVVPFRSQIAALREALAAHPELGPAFAAATLIDTVERFQGATRSVVLYTTVIRTPLQASMISAEPNPVGSPEDPLDRLDRKLNVALTRAKEHFILIGNATVLRTLRCYADLLDWIARPESRPDSGPDVGIYRETSHAFHHPAP